MAETGENYTTALRALTEERTVAELEVTILTQAGDEIACTVERYPELDRPQGDPRGQVDYYRAVPVKPVGALGTYEVQHTTPPHTAFFVDVPRGDVDTLLKPEPE